MPMTGSKVERVLEMAGMTANKNSVPGDTLAINPGGVRLGTPALTTHGLNVHNFDTVAEKFLHRGCTIAVKAKELAVSNIRGEGDVAILKGGGVNSNGGTGSGKVSLRDFNAKLRGDDALMMVLNAMKDNVQC
jgi:hypothetical protein